MQLKSLAICLGLFTSCAHAPDPVFCLSDLSGFACTDGRVREHKQIQNWVCFSPKDLSRFLWARRHCAATSVSPCISTNGYEAVCEGGEIRDMLSEPWTCVTPRDLEYFLKECRDVSHT